MKVGDLVIIDYCTRDRKGKMALVVEECASDSHVMVMVLDELTKHPYNISRLIKIGEQQ